MKPRYPLAALFLVISNFVQAHPGHFGHGGSADLTVPVLAAAAVLIVAYVRRASSRAS